MNLAANAVSELCKPRPSSETVEYTTKDFVKTLDVSLGKFLQHIQVNCSLN